mgnify:CR=1 FL=1
MFNFYNWNRIFIIICVFSFSVFAQKVIDPNYQNSIKEELLVEIFANGKNLGEVFVFTDSSNIFIPLKQLFYKLRIKVEEEDSIIKSNDFSGEYLFYFDFSNNTINCKDTLFKLCDRDFFFNEKDVFIKGNILSKILSSTIIFQKDLLEINFFNNNNFPFESILQRQINESKENIYDNELKQIYSLNEKLLNSFNVDYHINVLKYLNNDNSFYFGNFILGSRIFKGDFNSNLFIEKNNKIFSRYNSYSYRYVMNNKFLNQFIIGDFPLQNNENIYGIMFSNIPAYRKKNYVFIKEYLPEKKSQYEEIYFNGERILRDSDTIFIQQKYGLNYLEQNNYDYFGFNKQYRTISYIPEEIINKGNLEYSILLGRFKYYNDIPIFDFSFAYGLNERITLYSGLQYLNSEKYSKFYPQLNCVYQFLDNLILRSNIVINNFWGVKVNYYGVQNYLIEMNFRSYQKNNFYNRMNLKNEFSGNVNIPIKIKPLNLGFNLNYVYKNFLTDNTFSNIITNINLNYKNLNISFLLNNSFISNYYFKYHYDTYNVRTSYIFNNFYCSLTGSFDGYTKKITNTSFSVNRIIFKNTYFSFIYNKNLISGTNNYYLSIKFNPSTINMNFDFFNTENPYSYLYTGGNIFYDYNENLFMLNSNSMINRANSSFKYFIDENSNGLYDNNETLLNENVNFAAERGEYKFIQNKSIITNLEGYDYNKVFILSDNNNYKKTYYYVPLPNMLQVYFVPITRMTSVSGNIRQITRNKIPYTKLQIELVDSLTKVKYYPQIFSNGDYIFKNVKNGNYTLVIKNVENKFLIEPEKINLSINNKVVEDYIEDVNFLIKDNLTIDSNKIIKVKKEFLEEKKDNAVSEKEEKIKIQTTTIIFIDDLEKPNRNIKNYLNNLSEYLKIKKDIKIEIQVYTDNSGNFFDKITRCQTNLYKIKQLLLKYNISLKNITEKIYLDRNPLISNLLLESKKINNRIVIRLKGFVNKK